MMRKLSHWLLMGLLSLIALFSAACGGGGGGGAASGGVDFFMTDDLNTGFRAVWVTLYKVELEKQGGGFVTVFADANGKVFNLRALSDGNPRYAFVGKDGVPEGTYTGIRFTLDKDVHIVPNASSTAQPRVFDDTYISAGNTEQAVLSLTFSSPKTIAGGSNQIIADFVLSAWTENGVKIQNALLGEGSGSGIDIPDRHEFEDWNGTVQNLSGNSPNFTFTLQMASQNSVTVTTDTMTAIFNNNGAPNPTLSNGKRVEVRGKFDPGTNTVIATSIKIRGAGENENEDDDEVKGTASAVVAAAGTFDVEIDEAEGFVPTETSVHVTTSVNTRFFAQGGILLTQAQFFEIIATGNIRVEVEGTWTEATNTLAALKAKIEDVEDEHEAEARGTPNTIDANAGTFRIQLTEWEGFSSSVGTQINVTTNAGTRFRDVDGEEITKEEFFAQLAVATSVKAEGVFNVDTIAASQVRIRSGGGGENDDEARGMAININAGARTFDMVVVEWEGWNGSANLVIHVQMAANATFRGLDGETLTADAFFSQLATVQVAEVEGTFNASTNTMTAVKAKLED